MSKIVILKVKEYFNEEQLAALASEEEATITVTGTLEAVYFNAEDYYNVIEAAQMFDQMTENTDDEDGRNVQND
ncbi:hypothetical protein [Sulfurospirillum cavolei]|uniref:hypothetical protein n=1 Tax=Sulfurospirillum cavolei TaxID=366522 RepID=UPI000764C67D|nr:hypothetical protein [Sulfurospirillum cavolei]